MNHSYLTNPHLPKTVGSVADEQPRHIGRYRVERVLGEGGFGVVYLAHDDQLQRLVAIKVPHTRLVCRPEDAAAYLSEARTVARLDHPNIVPVYDVGSTAACPCFVVSKLIEGSTLAQQLKKDRPSVAAAVALVATVAQTLHYAHRQGLVHRDVKPGNILVDSSGKPYVADFGLALKEGEFDTETAFVGTPAYMSPEQARGEGHRVDGRSDLFSLGVVFYELLTGRRPFQAASVTELLQQIIAREARPPRQWDETIPKELERICLKALAKRASERYTTASDMAEDLRLFFEQSSEDEKSALHSRVATAGKPPPSQAATPVPSPPATPTPEQQPVRIVPKGLRSFDAHDADFFLELLPGPRDREGLPDSIRFWKTRVEDTDPDSTFAVGLIYGPSGCGKSSQVKAGLVPRLSGGVSVVYVEATADETEVRLLNGLRKRCPALAADRGLKETLAALRRGQGLPAGKKVLLVLDQFEQWLHARIDEDNTELVQALRQCDGGRLQCLVLVRDDFWMAATRFLRQLEIRLVEGQNAAAVDLFPPRHAAKVLTAFGRALGGWPENSSAAAKEHQQFVEQAVRDLAPEGKVVCVRLALFAEMMKGKVWTPAALQAVGGAAGVGAAFLEETFSAATAPPEHRYHQQAARAVLKALLPEAGTDIKGHMRSHADLLAASGYGSRPKDFNDLLRILDSEIRLITPTDPEGVEEVSGERGTALPSQPDGSGEPSHVLRSPEHAKYYQLTHDYLVPSLRDWLTRKQKETRRGRAELLLADRAVVWNGRPENRQLPSLLEWLQIRALTRKKNWTPPQRKMIRQAARYHLLRGLVTAQVVVLLVLVGWEGFGRMKAHNLRERILEANTTDVPGIVANLTSYRRWVDPLLHEAYAQAAKDNDRRKQLHASLALLPVDPGQVDYLSRRLLEAAAQEVTVIRAALLPHQAELGEQLWRILEDPKVDLDRRFRAACALALYTPDDPRWKNVSADVAARLVVQNGMVLGKWAEALQPVGRFLLPPLAAFLEDEKRNGSERGVIVTLYKTFAEGRPEAFAPLEKVLAEQSQANAREEAMTALAKRQANLGVALVAMGRGEKVWPLLKHSPDPTLRSFLIDRLARGGVDPKALLARFDKEEDVSIRRALLLSLGEFGLDYLPRVERQNLLPRLVQLYQDDPDPGIHSAAEWLVRQWEAETWLQEIDRTLATGNVEGKRKWYVNRQGQTMVLVPRPGAFWMGEGGLRRQQRITYNYAIAAKEVTVPQFLKFRKDHKSFFTASAGPVDTVYWYDATAYCNWVSEQEGIPQDQWCYQRNAKGEYEAVGNRSQRTGYRLATEAEWEYACRAGADTGYCYGEAVDLLSKYAWFDANSLGKSHPAGMLKPNDLGLFDMHGNAWEWCDDSEGPGGSRRVRRGGGWLDSSGLCRAACTLVFEPSFLFHYLGLRLARAIR